MFSNCFRSFQICTCEALKFHQHIENGYQCQALYPGMAKIAVPLQHRGTLNSHRAASPLVKLVEEKERWEAPNHPRYSPSKWGETELNHSVTCMGSSLQCIVVIFHIRITGASASFVQGGSLPSRPTCRVCRGTERTQNQIGIQLEQEWKTCSNLKRANLIIATKQERALDFLEVLGYMVVEDKAMDYAHLKQALTEQIPVVRNRSELETRFFASFQKHNQKPSDFVYDLLKFHKILKLEMTKEKLIDHSISKLKPQILDYVEVRHPQTTSNLLQIIDKYEERFLNRNIRGSSWQFRDTNPSENNRFPNRNRQENWRETRDNNRYADNSRPRREFNRVESQGVTDNRRFDGRPRGGQSDHRFHNQGGRQCGSRNSAFRGQNDHNRYLNF
ncbi:uncharacterized protein TNCV_3297411 [Trichonephila clavipes]|uniref:Uncharacterized protein n=1 Tax=Trichonephila clavipes TaxID=2585209 RepID=A0A8X7B8K2_TRICX|nr:uncharacterized protein TNCV_3297411 [Trichonephila clavipes]